MAKLSTRHQNGELMMFSDFTGGLNLSRPPETIEDNELQEAMNFEFASDTGMLKVRGGLSLVRSFSSAVDDIIPISGDILFIKYGKNVARYSMPDNTIQNTWDLGDDVSDKPAAYDFWGDSFQVLMAFGGHLWWSTEDGTLEEIEGNGIAWTERNAPEASWPSVCYGNNIFLAISGYGYCMTSPDGITWTKVADIPYGGLSAVCYGNGLFVAVGGNKCFTSPDGITWTERISPTVDSWYCVCYDNGLFVAASYSGGHVMTSSDGTNWIARDCPNYYWYSVCYGNGLFVAVSNDASGKVMTSPDGITWTEGTCPDYRWLSVCYGNGLFVAVSSSAGGKVMTSSNGITWTERTAISSSWASVYYGNGL
jgi:hypothetical protein